MEIRRIETGKWSYLPLLLIGDEQEDMVARYLDRGALFALYDGGALKTNHLYMATIEDRWVTAESGTVKVLARGGYSVR